MAELAFVASPLLVDGFVEPGVDPLQLAQSVVDLDVAAVGALRADRSLRMQIPGPRLEAIGARQQRADRTEFDHIAAELALILRMREGADLHICAAL